MGRERRQREGGGMGANGGDGGGRFYVQHVRNEQNQTKYWRSQITNN